MKVNWWFCGGGCFWWKWSGALTILVDVRRPFYILEKLSLKLWYVSEAALSLMVLTISFVRGVEIRKPQDLNECLGGWVCIVQLDWVLGFMGGCCVSTWTQKLIWCLMVFRTTIPIETGVFLSLTNFTNALHREVRPTPAPHPHPLLTAGRRCALMSILSNPSTGFNTRRATSPSFENLSYSPVHLTSASTPQPSHPRRNQKGPGAASRRSKHSTTPRVMLHSEGRGRSCWIHTRSGGRWDHIQGGTLPSWSALGLTRMSDLSPLETCGSAVTEPQPFDER